MSYVPPKKNTAYICYLSLVSQADTKLTKASPTLAAGDFQVSIDGGTLNNLTTLPTVTPAAGRMVKISLSAAEMNGDNITVVCSDAAGAEWCDLTINIQTSVQQVDDLATPTNITAGTITTVTNLTNAPTSGDLTATMKTSVTTACTASTPTAAAVTGAVGSVVATVSADVVEVTGSVDSADYLGAFFAGFVTGACTGTPTTTAFRDSGKEATDDYYNGLLVRFTSGNLAGLERGVSDYTGATKEFTLDEALPEAPVATNTYVLFGRRAPTVTENQSGMATAANLATVDGIVDGILLDTAEIGAAGAGLTALGDVRLANLDAAVSSRSTYAGGAVASVTGAVGSVTGSVGSVADAGASLTALGDARLANLDATVSSRLATASYTAPLDAAGTRTAVGLAAANLDTQLAAIPTATANADALLDRAAAVDTFTPRQVLRLELAALAGKSSGGAASGVSNPVFRAADDSKDRISSTVDAGGNRISVALDGT